MSFDILGVFLQLSFDENVEKKPVLVPYAQISENRAVEMVYWDAAWSQDSAKQSNSPQLGSQSRR